MSYSIRPCRAREELKACVALQQSIWGYADHELYPLRLFVNLGLIGGQVLGAFSPAAKLVGFVASMPAWHGRRRYFHSLSLGVQRGHENLGLGRRLKLAQRKAARAAGIYLIEWTFDPLRAKNAFFNIERLGAIVRRYSPNHYGPVESRLQQGLPSDRLVAEWWLNSKRVKRASEGKSPRPATKPPAAEVAIPADLESLVAADPAAARMKQAAVRQILQRAFSRGLAITGFARDEKGARYLLEPVGRAGVPREIIALARRLLTNV